jgi:gliding motility-associated transport system ATP-binding protein
MIHVDHVSRRYGAFTAVDDVSFSVASGEVVGLLGHNGAGKTTLMKMLTGYLEPTAGTIQVDDREIGRTAADTRAIQAQIGYLPENCPLWPEMTVFDYLAYVAGLRGVPEGKRDQAVVDAVRRTALKDKAAARIDTLSRGYRQRVGVAQALLHSPSIIILDEPTNGLDPTQIRQMRELIRELARGATVIVSTHVLPEVQAVCERVLVMRLGKLVVDARIDDLQRASRLLVRVDRDAQAVLAAVPGAGRVEARPDPAQRFTYAVDGGEDLAPAIAAAVQRAGLLLYALQSERRDLEAVFAEANTVPEAGASAPAGETVDA